MSLRISDEYAIVANTALNGIIDDDSVTTNYFSMANRHKAAFLIQVGGTDTTVDAAVKEATDSSGTDAQAITGLSITQAASTDDHTNYIINVDSSKLSAGFDHIACTITVGNGTSGAHVACIAIADSRYKAVDDDLAAVNEIV